MPITYLSSGLLAKGHGRRRPGPLHSSYDPIAAVSGNIEFVIYLFGTG